MMTAGKIYKSEDFRRCHEQWLRYQESFALGSERIALVKPPLSLLEQTVCRVCGGDEELLPFWLDFYISLFEVESSSFATALLRLVQSLSYKNRDLSALEVLQDQEKLLVCWSSWHQQSPSHKTENEHLLRRLLQASGSLLLDTFIERKIDRYESLLRLDPLTKCFNRRGLELHFDREYSRSKRYSYPLSVVMIDIDYFKVINDQYGHAVGDQVLEKLAQTVSGNLRQGDIIARYGGEEFCLLLPYTDPKQGKLLCQRLRNLVSQTIFPCVSDKGFQVTLSLGLTTLLPEKDERKPADLLKNADEAMYQAKRSGRDTVAVYDLETFSRVAGGESWSTLIAEARSERAIVL